MNRLQRIQKYIENGWVSYNGNQITFWANTFNQWKNDDTFILDLVQGLSNAVLLDGDVEFFVKGTLTGEMRTRFSEIIPKIQVISSYSGYNLAIALTKEPDPVESEQETTTERKSSKK